MRLLYVFLILLLPSFCLAQREFMPGSYELTNGTKGEGQLKYTSGSGAELIIKSSGKKNSFSPQEIKNFKVNNKFFVPVQDFVLDSGMPITMKFRIKNDFAELLDSGRVELLLYSFLTGSMKTHQSFYSYIYLIRHHNEQLTSIPAFPKKSIPVIASFIKDRPDLVARLNNLGKKDFNIENIRAIIQAYNSAQN